MIIKYLIIVGYVVLFLAALGGTWFGCKVLDIPWLMGFFVLPLTLAALHVAGDSMQTFNLGPDWAQNHLHNVGICGLNSFLAFLGIRKVVHDKGLAVRRIMNRMSLYSVIVTVAAVMYEIFLVTLRRRSSVEAGYSGQLDWIDIGAYGVGLILILTNHLVFWFFKLRK